MKGARGDYASDACDGVYEPGAASIIGAKLDKRSAGPDTFTSLKMLIIVAVSTAKQGHLLD